MIKAPIDLQDLRPRLYVKAKTETSWRLTAPRLRLAAVASPMAIPAVADSGANMISLINLEMKCAGTRSAGNPHAACEVAGAGNGITNIPSRARRGQPRIQTRDDLSGYRASSRPYQPGLLVRAGYCETLRSDLLWPGRGDYLPLPVETSPR